MKKNAVICFILSSILSCSVVYAANSIDNIQPVKVPAPRLPFNKYGQTHNVVKGLSFYIINEPIHDKVLVGKTLVVDPVMLEVAPAISVFEIKNPQKEGVSSWLTFLGFDNELPPQETQFGKRAVLTLANNHKAIAGVNGSFFFADGSPVGTLIIDKQIVSSQLLSRTSLLLYDNGTAAIDSLKIDGHLKINGDAQLPVSAINMATNKGTSIYTGDYRRPEKFDKPVNILVVDDKVKNMSLSDTNIPKNGFVISSDDKTIADRVKAGDSIKWDVSASPPINNVRHIITGGPRLVHKTKACVTAKEEKFQADVAQSSAARTAVGIADTGELIFVTVEKATLNELARLMINMGAVDAMNLDGGGSSSMVLSGKTVFGGDRPVSNAIVIKQK